MDNILDKLGHSRCFTALDLQSGFNQLRIKDYHNGVLHSLEEEIHGSDIHKTSFYTQYGTFECVIMPFGLAGAPSIYPSKVCFVYLRSHQKTLGTRIY